MKIHLFPLISMACIAAHATPEIPIPDGYQHFGELPQPTAGVGRPQPGRLPVALCPPGNGKPDIVALANGRVWYYINESKHGKILFSEPIELTDTEGNPIETDYFYGISNNRLMIHLAADLAVEAEITGADVPQLRFAAAPTPDGRTLPAYQAIADFDGDGVKDIVIGGAYATTLYSALGTQNSK